MNKEVGDFFCHIEDFLYVERIQISLTYIRETHIINLSKREDQVIAQYSSTAHNYHVTCLDMNIIIIIKGNIYYVRLIIFVSHYGMTREFIIYLFRKLMYPHMEIKNYLNVNFILF